MGRIPCIRKQGKDPRTGQRYLEELAFEVVYKQRGKELGEELGQRQATAAAVLAVLEGRGLMVTERVRAALEASTDLDELRRWLQRAITSASADEVIDER